MKPHFLSRRRERYFNEVNCGERKRGRGTRKGGRQFELSDLYSAAQGPLPADYRQALSVPVPQVHAGSHERCED